MSSGIFRDQLDAAAVQSFNNYLSHGARSSKKILPLHEAVRDHMRALGVTAEVEEVVDGKFYSKRCDVVGVNEKGDTCVASVKFPVTNFLQNANNYFESSLGETLNLKHAGVRVGHVILLPARLPYLNKEQKVEKIEKISDGHIDKYRALADSDGEGLPDRVFFQLVDVWGDELRVGAKPPKRKVGGPVLVDDHSELSFSDANRKFLAEAGDYAEFLSSLLSGE